MTNYHEAASAADEITEYDDQLVEGAGIIISVAFGLALWAAIAAVFFIVELL